VTGPDRVVLRVAPGSAAVGFTINSLGACLVLLARDLDGVLVAPVVLAAVGTALDLRTAYLIAVLPLALALATTAWKEPPCPTP
jgi:hypothetical protein